MLLLLLLLLLPGTILRFYSSVTARGPAPLAALHC
jgi:hypothetical protein